VAVAVRLLAFAYACEPLEGSEPGAGWMWARMLARYGDTWVITRSNNRERIEAAIEGVPERARLHFVYVDLPAWARFWKRGSRGLRPYYLVWQLAALRAGRRLHRTHGFDLVWHLTLANAWLGSSAALVGRPFVFGPVGGGVAPPWSLVWPTGTRSTISEVLRGAGRGIGRYLNPLARLAWGRADVILVQNPETVRWLPRRHRAKTRVFPNVVFSGPPDRARSRGDRPRTALFAGRLIAWKGADLAIDAIGKTSDWRLVICGEGADEPRLRRIVLEKDLLDRVEFRGRVPRPDVLRSMRTEAGVFLVPSLHDEAGWVLAEALAARLPAVCLDNGGPPLLADGFAIVVPTTGGREAVTTRLASALERARVLPMTGAADRADTYSIDRRSDMLSSVIERLLPEQHTADPEGVASSLDRNASMSADRGEAGEP
jgi:glycosyltransferase involved in cell wall biosynthesis